MGFRCVMGAPPTTMAGGEMCHAERWVERSFESHPRHGHRQSRSRSRSPARRERAGHGRRRSGSPGRRHARAENDQHHSGPGYDRGHGRIDRHRSRSRDRSPRRRHRHSDHPESNGAVAASRHDVSEPSATLPARSENHSRTRSHSSHHSRRRRRRSSTRSHLSASPDGGLPYGARTLSRWDFAAFEPLFAHYLEVHKQRQIATMDEHEVRGRWKSFVGKWNRGELAEGWYEPEMFLRVVRMRAMEGESAGPGGGPTSGGRVAELGGLQTMILTPPMSGRSVPESVAMTAVTEQEESDDDDDDDGYGPPPPPGQQNATSAARHGPNVPSMQDLDLRRELEESSRQDQIDGLRLARKADRAEQKERLDELVPRAEAGTRERQLEKKRALNEKLRGFRDKSPGGDAEVGDRELIGGEGDSVDDYKMMLATMQKRKTEREIRREEMIRARQAEREERLREYREREELQMAGLKELARQRFG